MRLNDIDVGVLKWLRGLGTEPIGATESNTLDLRFAASKAAEALGLPPDVAFERLQKLRAEGFVEVINRPGFTFSYLTRITDDGRSTLRVREQVRNADSEGRIVFVSCSQAPEDRELGLTIARIITDETPAVGYFAQNESTLEAVTTRILGGGVHGAREQGR